MGKRWNMKTSDDMDEEIAYALKQAETGKVL